MDERMVDTLIGRLPIMELEVKELKSEGENEITIVREWFHRGIFVRRDVMVTQLRGHSTIVTGKV